MRPGVGTQMFQFAGLDRALPGPMVAIVALLIFGFMPTPAEAQSVSFRCPMLYYHEVPSQLGLETHISAFVRAGYRPTTLTSVVDALDGLSPPPPGCMVLTFDDALRSQHRNALPVLNKWAMSGTFFVMPSFRDGVHAYMTPEEIREVADSGQEIGSHTLNHASLPALRQLNFGAYQSELHLSRALIEEMIGRPVDLFAYPNGAVDALTASDVATGYRAAASTIAGSMQSTERRYFMRRVGADPWQDPATVMAKFDQ